MALKLKVTQIKSGIGRDKSQRIVLKGIGVRGVHKSVIVQDTPAIRGMIRKVGHLVEVEPVE